MRLVLPLLLVILKLFFCDSFERVVVGKSCSSYNVTNSSFDISKFQGKWYEIAKYGQQGNCTINYITHIANTTRSNITHYTGSYKNRTSTTIVMVQKINSSNDLELQVERSQIPVKVLATDYNNYAVIWTCSDRNAFSSLQNVLILSQYNDEKLINSNAVRDVLNVTGISNNPVSLTSTNHSFSACNKGTIFGPKNSTNASTSATGASYNDANIITTNFITFLIIIILINLIHS